MPWDGCKPASERPGTSGCRTHHITLRYGAVQCNNVLFSCEGRKPAAEEPGTSGSSNAEVHGSTVQHGAILLVARVVDCQGARAWLTVAIHRILQSCIHRELRCMCYIMPAMLAEALCRFESVRDKQGLATSCVIAWSGELLFKALLQSVPNG